jgi:hypothetical protein
MADGVRLRPTYAQTFVPLAALPAVWVGVAVAMALRGHPIWSELPGAIGQLTVAVGVVAWLAARSESVELAPDHLRIRALGRSVPRSEITSVRVEPWMGVRRVVVHHGPGRRLALPAPTSFLDRRFDRKALAVLDWAAGQDGPPCRRENADRDL